MNPVIKEINDEHVAYLLTEEDRKRLSRIKLMEGAGTFEEEGFHQMCIMQAVASLTTQADERPAEQYTDYPICVSSAITNAMIALNDRNDITPRQRGQLRKVVEDILNTCPVKRKTKVLKTKVKVVETRHSTNAYRAAERKREEMLRPVKEGIYDDHGYFVRFLSMAEGIRLIRQAAELYKSTEVTHV